MSDSTIVREDGGPTEREQDLPPGFVELGTRPPLRQYVKQLWRRREFIWLIPRSDLRARSMNSVLGSVWHLLNPLLLALVFWIVFGLILDIGRVENYPAYLVIGIFVFGFTQKTLQQGARAVVNDVKLLRNINFPAAVLPLSTMISELLAHGYALVAMLVICVLTGETPNVFWLFIPVLALVQAVMNLGFAGFTSRLTVHFRDTEQFLPYVLRLWFYLSGVIFGAERFENPVFRRIFELNPPYAFIKATRDIIFDARLNWGFILLSIGWAVVIGVAGFVFFWRNEGKYSHVAD